MVAGNGGEFGREGGLRVCCDNEGGTSVCFFLCFLREDSVALVSEIFGEPGAGRLRFFEALGRPLVCFSGRCEGVLVPFVEEPDPGCLALPLSGEAFWDPVALRASSSSLSRSASLEWESLYCRVSKCHNNELQDVHLPRKGCLQSRMNRTPHKSFPVSLASS